VVEVTTVSVGEIVEGGIVLFTTSVTLIGYYFFEGALVTVLFPFVNRK
jgi:hypothetical protein